MNAHTKIFPQVAIDGDGTLTIPDYLCEKYGWFEGVEMEMIEYTDRVVLRSKAQGDISRRAVADLVARAKDLNPYRGPRLSDEDLQSGILEMAAAKYAAR